MIHKFLLDLILVLHRSSLVLGVIDTEMFIVLIEEVAELLPHILCQEKKLSLVAIVIVLVADLCNDL